MSENSEHPYTGVVEDDGRIRVEGPLSEENTIKKVKNEKGSVVVVKAQNKGAALLKIILNLLNKEKSK